MPHTIKCGHVFFLLYIFLQVVLAGNIYLTVFYAPKKITGFRGRCGIEALMAIGEFALTDISWDAKTQLYINSLSPGDGIQAALFPGQVPIGDKMIASKCENF